MRRLVFASIVLVGSVARADLGPPSSWPVFDDAKLGVHVKHPAGSKAAARGAAVEIRGDKLPVVTITVAATTERGRSKNGGVSDNHVEYTIDVPKRRAICKADAADGDQADAAAAICDTIELDPGKRDPHLELTVTSSGLADGAAYEHAVRAKQHALDACWTAALAKDQDLPEGSITLRRTYDHGAPAEASTSAENFFDHDAKPLAACVAQIVKGVAAKTAADSAQVEVDAICQLY